jgi:hypothetical protein
MRRAGRWVVGASVGAALLAGCGVPGGGLPGGAVLRIDPDGYANAFLGGPVDRLLEFTVHNDGPGDETLGVALFIVDGDEVPGDDLDAEISSGCSGPLPAGGSCTFKVHVTGFTDLGEAIQLVANGLSPSTAGDSVEIFIGQP